MPPHDQIFIFPEDHELLSGQASAAAEQERAALRAAFHELAAWAIFSTWLDQQSENVRTLAEEWRAIGPGLKRFAFLPPELKNGRIEYWCVTSHAQIRSYVSHEHALFLMVDAFRTRIEDKAETWDRIATIPAEKRAEAHRKLVEESRGRILQTNSKEGRLATTSAVDRAANRSAGRRVAEAIAKMVKKQNPRMPGPQRDALVLAEIAKLEKT